MTACCKSYLLTDLLPLFPLALDYKVVSLLHAPSGLWEGSVCVCVCVDTCVRCELKLSVNYFSYSCFWFWVIVNQSFWLRDPQCGGAGTVGCVVHSSDTGSSSSTELFQLSTSQPGAEGQRGKTHPSISTADRSSTATNPNTTGCPVCSQLPLKVWCQYLCTLHPASLRDTLTAPVFFLYLSGKHTQEMLHPGLAFSPGHEWDALE